MNTVKVSPKYQVVIPKQVRTAAQIKPGQLLQIFEAGGAIRLVPVRPLKELRGLARGLPPFEREGDREL